MKLIVFAAAGFSAFVILCLWMITKIQYRISERHLKILLFGVPLRKVLLTDIKRISKRLPSRWAERWYNTLKPGHKTLAIQRLSGLRRFVVITPRNRYIFLADLQKAIQRVKPEANAESIVEETPEETEA